MSALGWISKSLLHPLKSSLIGERVEQGECFFLGTVKSLTPKWTDNSDGDANGSNRDKGDWNSHYEDNPKKFKVSDLKVACFEPKCILLPFNRGRKATLSDFNMLSERYMKPKVNPNLNFIFIPVARSAHISPHWHQEGQKRDSLVLLKKKLKVEQPLPNICLKYNGWLNKNLLGQHKMLTPKVLQRHYHASNGNPEKVRELPKLFYIQNPLVWAANKLDFRYLRTSWDPTFSEQEFTRGARQAVSRITQLLSQSMFDALKPLLTKNAMINLRRDVEVLWADEVRRNVSLEPEDVQLIIPRKLHFRQQGDKRLCDIDVVFIALKFLDSMSNNPPLAFIDIIARFHRNYSEGITPDWTISAFKLRRFNVVPPK